jgi:hypothetical protein
MFMHLSASIKLLGVMSFVLPVEYISGRGSYMNSRRFRMQGLWTCGSMHEMRGVTKVLDLCA